LIASPRRTGSDSDSSHLVKLIWVETAGPPDNSPSTPNNIPDAKHSLTLPN
jgi:hypothetical protein